ncbi:hypothetical protein [Pseudonocardia alaniniphila]|uniref:Uncharacterized protein n=1 Tax=Pseudonocardia alaniniphila TaxID=75291 RepID=A0ABS9TSA4_9PSEU|nr:hypothetical protein [Pseudonocardia alaniniphila]MCH6171434.1 hypothetical protein [Pseudonocardia alaniniphila]
MHRDALRPGVDARQQAVDALATCRANALSVPEDQLTQERPGADIVAHGSPPRGCIPVVAARAASLNA